MNITNSKTERAFMIKNILMICTGNICRSPMAEYYLKQQLAMSSQSLDIKVHSAGVGAVIDHPATDEAQTVLKKYNIECLEHRGRQINKQIIEESDLILAAEKGHKYNVLQSFPTACGKIHRICENTDIPDPFRRPMRSFENALEMIIQGLNSWNQKFNWY